MRKTTKHNAYDSIQMDSRKQNLINTETVAKHEM